MSSDSTVHVSVSKTKTPADQMSFKPARPTEVYSKIRRDTVAHNDAILHRALRRSGAELNHLAKARIGLEMLLS